MDHEQPISSDIEDAYVRHWERKDRGLYTQLPMELRKRIQEAHHGYHGVTQALDDRLHEYVRITDPDHRNLFRQDLLDDTRELLKIDMTAYLKELESTVVKHGAFDDSDAPDENGEYAYDREDRWPYWYE